MQDLVRAKSAWASLVKAGFKPEPTSSLTSKRCDEDKGGKTFALPPQIISEGKRKWEAAIIGQVMGNAASFVNLKNFAEWNWAKKGLIETQKISDELFVFRFQTEDCKQEILEHSPMPFGDRVLILWPWVSNKKVEKLKLDSVPVWVRLPQLRFHYFNNEVLSWIGSLIGKPMFMDRATASEARVAFARICVEIKAGDPLPDKVKFYDEEGWEVIQEVTYEWMPIQCANCKTFGHSCEVEAQKKIAAMETRRQSNWRNQRSRQGPEGKLYQHNKDDKGKAPMAHDTSYSEEEEGEFFNATRQGCLMIREPNGKNQKTKDNWKNATETPGFRKETLLARHDKEDKLPPRANPNKYSVLAELDSEERDDNEVVECHAGNMNTEEHPANVDTEEQAESEAEQAQNQFEENDELEEADSEDNEEVKEADSDENEESQDECEEDQTDNDSQSGMENVSDKEEEGSEEDKEEKEDQVSETKEVSEEDIQAKAPKSRNAGKKSSPLRVAAKEKTAYYDKETQAPEVGKTGRNNKSQRKPEKKQMTPNKQLEETHVSEATVDKSRKKKNQRGNKSSQDETENDTDIEVKDQELDVHHAKKTSKSVPPARETGVKEKIQQLEPVVDLTEGTGAKSVKQYSRARNTRRGTK